MTVVRRLPLVPLLVLAFLFSINSNVVVDARRLRTSVDDQNERSGEVDDTDVAPKSPRVLQLVSPRRTSLEDRFRVALKDASADCNRLTEGKVGFDCQLHVEQQLGPIDFVADAYIKIEVNNDEQTYNLDGWIDISPAIGRHPFELDEIKIKDPQPFCYVSGVKGCIGVRNVKIDTEKRIFEGIIYLMPCWVQLVELCLTFDVYPWKITWEGDAVSREMDGVQCKCKVENKCSCEVTLNVLDGVQYATDLIYHQDTITMPIMADGNLLLPHRKTTFTYGQREEQCEDHKSGEQYRCFYISDWREHTSLKKHNVFGTVNIAVLNRPDKKKRVDWPLFDFKMRVSRPKEEVGIQHGDCTCTDDKCTCKATYNGVRYTTDIIHRTDKHHEDTITMPMKADGRLLLPAGRQEFKYSGQKFNCEKHAKGEPFRCIVIEDWAVHPKLGTSGTVVVEFYDGKKKSATSEEVLFTFLMHVTRPSKVDQSGSNEEDEEENQKTASSSRRNEKIKDYKNQKHSKTETEEDELQYQQKSVERNNSAKQAMEDEEKEKRERSIEEDEQKKPKQSEDRAVPTEETIKSRRKYNVDRE